MDSSWNDPIKMEYTKTSVVEKTNLRRYQRKLDRLEKNIQNKLFPVKLEWLIWAMIGIAVLNTVGYAPCNEMIDGLANTLERYFGTSIWNRVVSVTVMGAIMCTVTVFTIRLAFTLLLYYHGFLFEEIGKPISLSTKLFMMVILFVNKYATFFSYVDLLPWQLIPSLDATLKRYLQSVRPILTDEEFAKTEKLASDFKASEGSALQRKLWLKWLTSKNYVSDWWREVVYLRHRGSLIHSNVSCADVVYQKTTNIQAARAAVITILRLQFLRETMQKQSSKPISLGGIPLCPRQYLDYYRGLRIPTETADKCVRLPDSRYIAVYCKGCWYRVDVIHNRRLIRSAELEKTLQAIINRTPDPVDHEPYLAALTSGPRDLWARIRADKFSTGINKESLTVIENSLEIVFLDDEDQPDFDVDNPAKILNSEYARALHGHGHLLWCDKASIHIFSKNGRCSSNAEHSSVDGMVLTHVREYMKYHERYSNLYQPDGHCRGEIEVIPAVERLHFVFDDETKAAIDEAYTVSKGIADNFENATCIFRDFGKDFIKKAKVSPDAFIQMALQMAYYKDQYKFGLTYEPVVMRLFKNGRTETVRSCTTESCAFVKAMEAPETPDAEVYELLRAACARHQDNFRLAMAGHGCDRHLFALYVVSAFYKISSPFLDFAFNQPYKLSTSQTPQHQIPEYMSAMNKDKEIFFPSGSFCCPDGSDYGVCYTISGPGDCFSFHVSSWKSLQHTDPQRFLDTIVQSLNEIKTMVERVLKN